MNKRVNEVTNDSTKGRTRARRNERGHEGIKHGTIERTRARAHEGTNEGKERTDELMFCPRLALTCTSLFAIIPIRSLCTMWPNYPVTERVGTAFKLIQRKGKFTVMCSRSSQNLEFGHFTLSFGQARRRNLKRTCRAFVFSFCDVLVVVGVVAS